MIISFRFSRCYLTRIISIFFTCFVLVFSSSAQKSYAPGETLIYKAYYHWGLVWVAAASISLEALPNQDNRYITLRAEGESYKRYDFFFKLREYFESTINRSTLLPVTAEREAHEGSYSAKETLKFNQATGVVNYKIVRGSGKNSEGVFNNVQGYCDMLSAAYYFREYDFTKMQRNDTYYLNTIVDGGLYNIQIRFLGNETATDDTGKSYFCSKFSVSTIKGNVFKGDERITMWLSNDAAKIPVRIVSKIRVGEINVALTSASGVVK